MATKGNKVMTQAEEIAELRRWMREDIGNLHTKLELRDEKINEKLDDYQESNHEAHVELQKQLTNIDKKTDSNTNRIALFSAGIALLASGAVTVAFNVIAG